VRWISIQDIVAEIRTNFDISDEQALYIREVTEEKTKDRAIQTTVEPHRKEHFYLEGPFKPPTPNAGVTMSWLSTNTLIPAQFSTSWPSRHPPSSHRPITTAVTLTMPTSNDGSR
jgi:hypothetical protein